MNLRKTQGIFKKLYKRPTFIDSRKGNSGPTRREFTINQPEDFRLGISEVQLLESMDMIIFVVEKDPSDSYMKENNGGMIRYI